MLRVNPAKALPAAMALMAVRASSDIITNSLGVHSALAQWQGVDSTSHTEAVIRVVENTLRVLVVMKRQIEEAEAVLRAFIGQKNPS